MNSDELISFPLVSLPTHLGASCDCQVSVVCSIRSVREKSREFYLHSTSRK